MTDLERTKEFFKSLGYAEVMIPQYFHHHLEEKEFYVDPDDAGHTTINFGSGIKEEQTDYPIFGYSGFGFCLSFDKDGKFVGHGAYE